MTNEPPVPDTSCSLQFHMPCRLLGLSFYFVPEKLLYTLEDPVSMFLDEASSFWQTELVAFSIGYIQVGQK